MLTALLIPLKSFRSAKERLSPEVSESERFELAQSMAGAVVAAAGDLPVWVVCDDPAVSGWASRSGANVVWRGGGLNGAVQAAFRFLGAEGFDRVIISHGDLPNAKTFQPVVNAAPDSETVVLVTDRFENGTNVLSLPANSGFRVQYGEDSYARHRIEAERLGLPSQTVTDPNLSLDIDYVSDLNLLRESNPA